MMDVKTYNKAMSVLRILREKVLEAISNVEDAEVIPAFTGL